MFLNIAKCCEPQRHGLESHPRCERKVLNFTLRVSFRIPGHGSAAEHSDVAENVLLRFEDVGPHIDTNSTRIVGRACFTASLWPIARPV